MRFHSCGRCGRVFDREAEGSGREFLRHDCDPTIRTKTGKVLTDDDINALSEEAAKPGARQWKNMRPRRRTGPFLRVRDAQGRFVK